MTQKTDYLVIGAGIVGLSIARELKRRDAGASVTVIDKESSVAQHASGRNSGVLHAGFYYSPDSLKARFTRRGNEALTEFCRQHDLVMNRCGKLVVAKNEDEQARLVELRRRGTANGVELHGVTAAEARRIEPRIKTHEEALWSPSTTTIDPVQVMHALLADARALGVRVEFGQAFQHEQDGNVRTNQGVWDAGYVVNAAGTYADRVAREFGFGKRYRILPFKGSYLYGSPAAGPLATNIYPVPDLDNPFLGVHFTVTHDGHIKIGPNAMPALWNEQYGGVKNFRTREFATLAVREASLAMGANFPFFKLAWKEMRKRSRRHLVALAGQLVDGVRLEDYPTWGEPGIRAQLLDRRERRLVMDFVVEADPRSLHVLNAVSPGFTCALPFAEYVCDEVRRQQR